jgi:succinoglycan biosynthesis protein ExoA
MRDQIAVERRSEGEAAHVDVSVLVPVRNEESHIHVAIESIRAQQLEDAVEFLVLEGGSTDSTRAIVERAMVEDPRIRLIDTPGPNTPRALNVGLRATRGEFIARMDAHTHYPPGYLAAGLARMRRGDVACVTGPAIATGVDRWSHRIALALGTWLGTGGAAFRHAVDGEIEVDRGFTGVWRRRTLEALGGWDEGSSVNQDSELAARIRKDGGRIVCVSQMAAHYIPRSSLRALARQYWRYGQYRARTTSRHPESLRPSHLLAPGLALASVASVTTPRRLAGAPRAGLFAYAMAVLATSARAGNGGPRTDALALPLVFATMHLAWGFGFLYGCLRFRPAPRAFAGHRPRL